jgi:hypothetical protein
MLNSAIFIYRTCWSLMCAMYDVNVLENDLNIKS